MKRLILLFMFLPGDALVYALSRDKIIALTFDIEYGMYGSLPSIVVSLIFWGTVDCTIVVTTQNNVTI